VYWRASHREELPRASYRRTSYRRSCYRRSCRGLAIGGLAIGGVAIGGVAMYMGGLAMGIYHTAKLMWLSPILPLTIPPLSGRQWRRCSKSTLKTLSSEMPMQWHDHWNKTTVKWETSMLN